MSVNRDQFVKHEPWTSNCLAAMGWKNGVKQGGIINPAVVDIPAGARLIRFQAREELGSWWFTAHELQVLFSHLGHTDIVTGRASGTGALHKAGAVMLGWNAMSHVVDFYSLAALSAFHGPGDGYVTEDGRFVRGLRMLDDHGQFRPVRQLFLPHFADYASRCAGAPSLNPLNPSWVKRLLASDARRLPFES